MYEKENFDDFVCTRCNHMVRKRIKNSLQVSLALTICAILLYIPAMVYPIMEVTRLGVKVESTMLEGVISFLDMESYFIAIVIFTASVVIPMIKLVGLLFIFYPALLQLCLLRIFLYRRTSRSISLLPPRLPYDF